MMSYPPPTDVPPEEFAELMAEFDITEQQASVVRGLNLA